MITILLLKGFQLCDVKPTQVEKLDGMLWRLVASSPQVQMDSIDAKSVAVAHMHRGLPRLLAGCEGSMKGKATRSQNDVCVCALWWDEWVDG